MFSSQRYFATEFASKMAEKDYYSILDIPSYATDEEIKAAYRSLAKKHHPDVRASDQDGTHDPDVEKFRDVVEAYHVLSVKESRAAFDLTRKRNPHLYEQQVSDEQFDMIKRRDMRDKRGVSPTQKPARGSYAE